MATPFAVGRTADKPHERYVSGALYSSVGKLIPLSQRFSGHGGDTVHLVDPATIDPKPSRHVPGRGLYIGHIFKHYGHFITEGLGQLWYVINHVGFDYYAAHPFLFGGPRRTWMIEAFERLGIPIKRVHIVAEETVFEDITISERIWTINSQSNLAFVDVLERLVSPPIEEGLCLYLSRSGIKKRAVANEAEVERAFAEQGYRIVRPEELSFGDQLRLYASADIIAGFAGSQLHNVLFCKPGTLVISILDGHRRLVPNQIICNALRHSAMIVVPFKQCTDGFDVATLAPVFPVARGLLSDRRRT